MLERAIAWPEARAGDRQAGGDLAVWPLPGSPPGESFISGLPGAARPGNG
jgi:hypothetical protein